MDSLLCFACVCRFALAIKLSQPTSFLMCALLILHHIVLGVVSTHPCGAQLPTGVKPQQPVISVPFLQVVYILDVKEAWLRVSGLVALFNWCIYLRCKREYFS